MLLYAMYIKSMRLENTIIFTILRYADAVTVKKLLKITPWTEGAAIPSLKQNLWLQGMVGDINLTKEGFMSLTENYGEVLVNNKGVLIFPSYIKSILSTKKYIWVLDYIGTVYYSKLTSIKWVKVLEDVDRIRSYDISSIIMIKGDTGAPLNHSYYINKIEGNDSYLNKISTAPFIDAYVDVGDNIVLITDQPEYARVKALAYKEGIISSLVTSGETKISFGIPGTSLSLVESSKALDKRDKLEIYAAPVKEDLEDARDDFIDFENERFADNLSEYENNTYFGEGTDT